MKELSIKNYKGINVTDSREVAEMIGKNHKELMRSIRGYVEILEPSAKLRSADFFIESTYQDANNQTRPCYLLTKQGCEMVANKMTGEKGILFTAEYVQAFNKMEQSIKSEVKQLSPIEQLQLQNEAILEVNTKTNMLDDRITTLEERMTIETGKQKVLQDLVKKKVTAILGGKDTPAYKELGKKAFSKCWHDYKTTMQVASYKDTPVKDFELAKKVIIDWEPNRELELMIKGCNAQIRM